MAPSSARISLVIDEQVMVWIPQLSLFNYLDILDAVQLLNIIIGEVGFLSF